MIVRLIKQPFLSCRSIAYQLPCEITLVISMLTMNTTLVVTFIMNLFKKIPRSTQLELLK